MVVSFTSFNYIAAAVFLSKAKHTSFFFQLNWTVEVQSKHSSPSLREAFPSWTVKAFFKVLDGAAVVWLFLCFLSVASSSSTPLLDVLLHSKTPTLASSSPKLLVCLTSSSQMNAPRLALPLQFMAAKAWRFSSVLPCFISSPTHARFLHPVCYVDAPYCVKPNQAVTSLHASQIAGCSTCCSRLWSVCAAAPNAVTNSAGRCVWTSLPGCVLLS